MSDKLLTDGAWKGFAKGRGLDDGALQKALARLGKADETQPDEWLAALQELEATLNKQLASNARRKDKDMADVKARLQDMLAANTRALIKAKAAQATKTKAAQDSEDDNEASPALLSTRMIPLVRVLRGADERMQALVGVLGAEAVVLITPKPIGVSHKKLIAGQLGSGVKWSEGTCWFEGGALTFGVDKSPGQLAKKISAALIKQLGLKLRVLVRSADGTSEEEEGEHTENGAGQRTPPAHSPVDADAAAKALQAFNTRLAVLLPAVKAVMSTNADIGRTLKQQVAQAGSLAQAKDVDAAMLLLDKLETVVRQLKATSQPLAQNPQDQAELIKQRLLGLSARIKPVVAAGGPLAQTVRDAVAETGKAAAQKDIATAQAALKRLETLLARGGTPGKRPPAPVLPVWAQAKDSVSEQISRLQTAFRRSSNPLAHEIADKGLNGITRRLQVGLQTALMDYDAASAEQSATAASRLRSATAAMRQFLDNDPVLPVLEKNPYGVMVTVRSTLGKALDSIERQMA